MDLTVNKVLEKTDKNKIALSLVKNIESSDLITKFNGAIAWSTDNLTAIITSKHANGTIKITENNGNTEINIFLKLSFFASFYNNKIKIALTEHLNALEKDSVIE